MDFKNESNLSFKDISSEKYRVYVWESGAKITIDNPLQLNVSDNGHRVFDASGISHYIPKGWFHLYWEAKEGQANFKL